MDTETTLHATTVDVNGVGLVILGASGRGKSSLALSLMGMGANLVADDRTIIASSDDGVIATCPGPIQGQIEARGIGIIHVAHVRQTTVGLVVDLDTTETSRMPLPDTIELLGQKVPLLKAVDSPSFAASLYFRLIEISKL